MAVLPVPRTRGSSPVESALLAVYLLAAGCALLLGDGPARALGLLLAVVVAVRLAAVRRARMRA